MIIPLWRYNIIIRWKEWINMENIAYGTQKTITGAEKY